MQQMLKFILILTCLFSGFAYGETLTTPISSVPAFLKQKSPVKPTLLLEDLSIQPGHPFWVAIHLTIDKDWHAYWKNPGGTGFPIAIDWELPTGFSAGDIQWPHPERLMTGGGISYGYTDDVTLLVQIVPPKDIKTTNANLKAKINWLVCSETTCLPGEASLSIDAPITAVAPKLNEQNKILFKETRDLLPHKAKVAIKQDKDCITLEIAMSPTFTITPEDLKLAYFCPETQEMIQDAQKVSIQKKEDNLYTVTFKRTGEKNVRGNLVFQKGTGDDAETQAWDLNIALNDDVGVKAGNSNGNFHEQTATNSDTSSVFLTAVIFAFLGGLILNLMPCVLPVISLKMMSFVKMSGQARSVTFKHGLIFSLGVLISFWILATILIVLQSYGQSMGWGFQLQEPLFVAVLAAILLIFALSLFGVFEFGTFFASWAGQAESDVQNKTEKPESLWGSFFSGVLATAVATPCTGPFLGSAIGFAMTLSPFLSLLVFTSLGLGMASPYLLLSAYPQLIRFLPKPGAWMVGFKEFLGFCMLATVLWLLWVFAAQTSTAALFSYLVGALFVALACWVYGRWGTPFNSRNSRYMSYVATFLLFACGTTIIFNSAMGPDTQEIALNEKGPKTDWQVFSPEKVQELRNQGIPVLVDFTARWCLICQTNHMVLSTKEVSSKLKEMGIVKMEADWTKRDPVITEELRKYGRNGVPLYLIYPGDPKAEPIILPQVLTPELVIENLKEVKPAPSIAIE
jgi:thiol:disulfide interchange protein DsbD